MSERDPREHPVKGDVLGKRGTKRTVVDVRSGIVRPGLFVTSTSYGTGSKGGESVWSGERWRAWAKTATVIRRGDEA